MKKILLIILIVISLISCKKKDDDTTPTAPKTTLADRVGVYKGNINKDFGIVQYAIVELKSTGEVLCNWSGSIDTVGISSSPILDIKSTDTVFNQVYGNNSDNAKITFTSKTTIKLETGTLKSQGYTDFITLTKE